MLNSMDQHHPDIHLGALKVVGLLHIPVSSHSQENPSTSLASSRSVSHHRSSSQTVSLSRPLVSSQSASFFVYPTSQMRTTSLSSHTVSQSEVSTFQSLAKHPSAQVWSQTAPRSLQSTTSHPPNYVSRPQLPSDEMNSTQLDENTSKLKESENERQEQSSVVQVYIPEIRSVGGTIENPEIRSLTLVHMDGKSKDNRKTKSCSPKSFLENVDVMSGILSEEDRWYRDENLAYVGHSVRKNIRDANEHKIVMLLSLDFSDMGLKGADNFALGSSVEEKVDEIKEIGVVDNFKNHAESERIKFPVMLGCYNLYNNKEHYDTIPNCTSVVIKYTETRHFPDQFRPDQT